LAYDAASAGNREVIKIALGRLNADRETPQTRTTRTVVVRFGNEICVNQESGEGGAAAWQRAVPPPIMGANPNPPPAQINKVSSHLNGGVGNRSDTYQTKKSEWCNCLAVDPFDSSHIVVASESLLSSKD
jgi:hypothetical protein